MIMVTLVEVHRHHHLLNGKLAESGSFLGCIVLNRILPKRKQ